MKIFKEVEDRGGLISLYHFLNAVAALGSPNFTDVVAHLLLDPSRRLPEGLSMDLYNSN